MAQIELHPDFKDFLRLLNLHQVEYLMVGGYAVGYYGYPRATGDMDIWIAVNPVNAEKTAQALRDFGFSEKEATGDLFITKDRIIRMGIPPVRIEVITGASGVNFEECYLRREVINLDDIPVNFLSLEDLKANKLACGRHRDLDDLKHLP
jgi:hypothetical protein